MNSEKILFKAFIRVVKSLYNSQDQYMGFDVTEVIREPIIEAENKQEVKEILLKKYPQFFQNDKIYERETKDQAQFFYVVIFPLYEWEKEMISEGQWACSRCGHVHENKYIERPVMNERLLGSDKLFCRNNGNLCMDNYIKEKYKNIEIPDDIDYIKQDSPNYIYKITQKSTNKSYIGKTRNAPFFRWWAHLTKSQSPFGILLRQTKLSDWTFEILEELPANISDNEVFRIESEYMSKHNTITNGFNQVVSNKNVVIGTGNLFEETIN